LVPHDESVISRDFHYPWNSGGNLAIPAHSRSIAGGSTTVNGALWAVEFETFPNVEDPLKEVK
jgi:hypothetical protein